MPCRQVIAHKFNRVSEAFVPGSLDNPASIDNPDSLDSPVSLDNPDSLDNAANILTAFCK